jgi:hypothetical protein
MSEELKEDIEHLKKIRAGLKDDYKNIKTRLSRINKVIKHLEEKLEEEGGEYTIEELELGEEEEEEEEY